MRIIAFLSVIIIIFAIAAPVLQAAENPAEGIQGKMQTFFNRIGDVPDEIGGVDQTNQLASRVGVVIRTALSLSVVVFLIITVYSGIQWMTAGGNEETVKKARTRITRAVIGIIIVIGAWAATSFIINSVAGARQTSGGGTFRFSIW